MTNTLGFAPQEKSSWRRIGSCLALAASLAFALQPSLLLAQVQVSDPDRTPVQPHAKPKRRPGARRKPPGPKGGGDDRPTHRGSVPKVPLVKV